MSATALSRSARFWLLHLVLPVALLLALLVALEASGLDRRISDAFFDPVSRSFPLKDDFILEKVLRRGVKYAVVASALVVFAAWALSCLIPRLAAHRRLLLFVWLAMAASSSTISGLKALSPRHCPYDLQEYGGTVASTTLFQGLPPGAAPGHCFPGGHASTGFSLFAGYFAALHLGRMRLAIGALIFAASLGMGLGLGRVAQGAHFLSHNLWTALICWTVTVALYAALLRGRKPLNPHGASV
ncbi:MAG TPA: phosphatase PAP2 family protein [Burkholderiales bacterium]|jgi:membrane-associated PAP2 superfamily phosphatase|nr:phosphatase PAP2 family protein [Burkholderiales bacterium]